MVVVVVVVVVVVLVVGGCNMLQVLGLSSPFVYQLPAFSSVECTACTGNKLRNAAVRKTTGELRASMAWG